MIKHKKIIISLLLAYALFIVGIFNVRAASVSINLNDSYPKFTYGTSSTEYSATWNWPTYNQVMYYQWSASGYPIGNNLVGLNITNIRFNGTIQGYDYALLHTYTIGSVNYNMTNLIINNICGSQVYGYALNNQVIDKSIAQDNLNNSRAYSTTFYIDLSSLPSECTSDFTSWRFTGTSSIDTITGTSPSGTIYFGMSSSAYLGKKGDSTYKEIENNTNNINNSINTMNDNITDSTIDTNNTNSSVSGFSSSTNSSMTNTPVSSMISLPITFLTGVNNALSNSCTNVNYIELFDYQLVLPCLNLSERLGSVWTIIDTIFSCMLIFSIGKSLVSTFARLSDMDTNIMYECYANGTKHRGESFDD